MLEYGRHVARLLRRCAYAPTSNTASHDNHEKPIHEFSLVPEMGMELRLLALQAAGAPLLSNYNRVAYVISRLGLRSFASITLRIPTAHNFTRD